MDIFIISRDGSKQSVMANLATAMALKQQGLEVTLAYVQEAMVAVAENKFQYRGLLESYQDSIEKTINDMGFPTDPIVLLKMAREAGVEIITCPIWAAVAGTENKLPSEIKVVELKELFQVIARSKKILGQF